MMKFGVILREVGLNPEDFKCAEIPVVFYDRKDRIDEREDIKFVERLFAKNDFSFKDFYLFLKRLENQTEHTKSINVKIDEFSVIVFYKTPNARIFSRKEPIDPMDYMD